MEYINTQNHMQFVWFRIYAPGNDKAHKNMFKQMLNRGIERQAARAPISARLQKNNLPVRFWQHHGTDGSSNIPLPWSHEGKDSNHRQKCPADNPL